MSFEQSPEFRDGKIKSRWSLLEWLAKNQRVLFAVTGILVVIVLALSARSLGISSGKPGGLDGCITNAAGEPITGTAQVENIQRSIPADGCFFFTELPPGEHDLLIQTSSGLVKKQVVKIVSGQAVGLGTIALP
jgi:hypothetical protein